VAAESPLAAGLQALRRFWRPFLLIQGAAVALVVGYHASPGVRDVCATLAAWRTAGGVPFAAASAAFAGGLLPELAKLVAQRGRAGALLRGRAREIAFNTVFFAFNGVVVDGLYRALAALFGDGTGAATVAVKMAVDQFVFTPPWLCLIVTLFLWQRRGFSWAATRPALRRGFLRAHVAPLLLPDWLFWIPMVCVVYAFPLPLQFLLFILALAAWSLIMVVIAGGEAAAGEGGESGNLAA
jgi:hypothetical protein